MENGTSTAENNANASDYFCTELFVGPLVWGIFSVPCACVGVPASVWLLWVLIQRQRQGLTNDIYMLNLTIMDLLFNLYIIPDMLNNFVWKDVLFMETSLLLQFFSMCGRPLFMACICVDCYMAVVHPIMYRTLKPSRHRIVTSTVVWSVTLGWGLIFFLGKDTFFDTVWQIPAISVVLFIILCDVAIFCALRNRGPTGNSHVHPLKRRARQAVINSLVMTVLSYLVPIVTEAVLQQVWPGEKQVMRCSILFPMLITSMLGSTLLPVLHLANLGGL